MTKEKAYTGWMTKEEKPTYKVVVYNQNDAVLDEFEATDLFANERIFAFQKADGLYQTSLPFVAEVFGQDNGCLFSDLENVQVSGNMYLMSVNGNIIHKFADVTFFWNYNQFSINVLTKDGRCFVTNIQFVIKPPIKEGELCREEQKRTNISSI